MSEPDIFEVEEVASDEFEKVEDLNIYHEGDCHGGEVKIKRDDSGAGEEDKFDLKCLRCGYAWENIPSYRIRSIIEAAVASKETSYNFSSGKIIIRPK